MSLTKAKIKKPLVIILCAVVVLLCAAAVGAWSMFGTFLVAAGSIERLEDGLYSMEYVGDYGLDEFLAQGGAASDSALADWLTGYLSRGFYRSSSDVQTGDFGCSAICIRGTDGTVFFGRNYDWEPCSAMIIHTRPDNGYESVSTCCLDFLGFGSDYTPDGSMAERIESLAAIYVPLDGMNSEGLMVADLMAGDDEQTHQQTGKAALTTTTAIRLLLDRAANVEEALALLGQYDMNSSIDSAHHLFIADADGNSVVVEYVGGEMLVADAAIVTNHYIAPSEKQGIGSVQSHERYDTLAACAAPAGESGVREILMSVAQLNYPQSADGYEKTMWSIVYTPDEQRAEFSFNENFERSYSLALATSASFLKG